MGLQGMINHLLEKSDFSLAIEDKEVTERLKNLKSASHSDVAEAYIMYRAGSAKS